MSSKPFKKSQDPLKNLTDLQLIENIRNKKNADLSFNSIICRHNGIYLDMVHTYNQRVDNDFHKKELIDEMHYNVYKAVMKYDHTKGAKFSTHLGNETKWMCLNRHSKNRKRKTFLLDEATKSMLSCSNDGEISKSINNEMIEKVLEIVGDHPDKRVKKIFKMRYIIGNKNKVMPWKQISNAMDISVQGCINIHNSALNNIKTKLAKET
tara:strand:- start:5697 stop:6323 length:627 start_codon:yes stop_codon:yes gene_type:complete